MFQALVKCSLVIRRQEIGDSSMHNDFAKVITVEEDQRIRSDFPSLPRDLESTNMFVF